MGLLRDLKLSYRPPRRSDPEFGELVFMYMPNAPERSYWEARWRFPPTGSMIDIVLPGPESGPLAESREFYRALVPRFAALQGLARPGLDHVFRHWFGRPISDDLWQDVTLGGFGLEDPRTRPVEWDMGFETTGKEWLGITVPFRDETPGDPVVDT